MTPGTIVAIAFFSATGLLLGWFGQRSYIAHGDVKVAKTRLRGGRRTRWRAGAIALLLIILIVLAIKDVAF